MRSMYNPESKQWVDVADEEVDKKYREGFVFAKGEQIKVIFPHTQKVIPIDAKYYKDALDGGAQYLTGSIQGRLAREERLQGSEGQWLAAKAGLGGGATLDPVADAFLAKTTDWTAEEIQRARGYHPWTAMGTGVVGAGGAILATGGVGALVKGTAKGALFASSKLGKALGAGKYLLPPVASAKIAEKAAMGLAGRYVPARIAGEAASKSYLGKLAGAAAAGEAIGGAYEGALTGVSRETINYWNEEELAPPWEIASSIMTDVGTFSALSGGMSGVFTGLRYSGAAGIQTLGNVVKAPLGEFWAKKVDKATQLMAGVTNPTESLKLLHRIRHDPDFILRVNESEQNLRDTGDAYTEVIREGLSIHEQAAQTHSGDTKAENMYPSMRGIDPESMGPEDTKASVLIEQAEATTAALSQVIDAHNELSKLMRQPRISLPPLEQARMAAEEILPEFLKRAEASGVTFRYVPDPQTGIPRIEYRVESGDWVPTDIRLNRDVETNMRGLYTEEQQRRWAEEQAEAQLDPERYEREFWADGREKELLEEETAIHEAEAELENGLNSLVDDIRAEAAKEAKAHEVKLRNYGKRGEELEKERTTLVGKLKGWAKSNYSKKELEDSDLPKNFFDWPSVRVEAKTQREELPTKPEEPDHPRYYLELTEEALWEEMDKRGISSDDGQTILRALEADPDRALPTWEEYRIEKWLEESEKRARSTAPRDDPSEDLWEAERKAWSEEESIAAARERVRSGDVSDLEDWRDPDKTTLRAIDGFDEDGAPFIDFELELDLYQDEEFYDLMRHYAHMADVASEMGPFPHREYGLEEGYSVAESYRRKVAEYERALSNPKERTVVTFHNDDLGVSLKLYPDTTKSGKFDSYSSGQSILPPTQVQRLVELDQEIVDLPRQKQALVDDYERLETRAAAYRDAEGYFDAERFGSETEPNVRERAKLSPLYMEVARRGGIEASWMSRDGGTERVIKWEPEELPPWMRGKARELQERKQALEAKRAQYQEEASDYVANRYVEDSEMGVDHWLEVLRGNRTMTAGQLQAELAILPRGTSNALMRNVLGSHLAVARYVDEEGAVMESRDGLADFGPWMFRQMDDLKKLMDKSARFIQEMDDPKAINLRNVTEQKVGQANSALRATLENEKIWGGAAAIQARVNKAFANYSKVKEESRWAFGDYVAQRTAADPKKIQEFLRELADDAWGRPTDRRGRPRGEEGTFNHIGTQRMEALRLASMELISAMRAAYNQPDFGAGAVAALMRVEKMVPRMIEDLNGARALKELEGRPIPMIAGAGLLGSGAATGPLATPLAISAAQVFAPAQVIQARAKVQMTLNRKAERMANGVREAAATLRRGKFSKKRKALGVVSRRMAAEIQMLKHVAGEDREEKPVRKEDRHLSRVVKDAQDVAHSVASIAANPEKLAKITHDATRLLDGAPKTKEAVVTSAQNVIRYLDGNHPTGMNRTIDLTTGRPKFLTTEVAGHQYMDMTYALNDPIEYMTEGFVTGSLLVPSMKAIREVFPDVVSEWEMLFREETAGQEIPATMGAQVTAMLGTPATALYDGSVMSIMQGIHKSKEDSMEKKNKPGRRGLSKVGENTMSASHRVGMG